MTIILKAERSDNSLMVKHRRRRGRRRGIEAIPVDVAMALSTLADNTVLALDLMPLQQDCYVISGDLEVALTGQTAGQGPIAVGITMDQLTVAQIKEAIEAAPQSQADIIAREQARRPVRRIGQFPGLNTDEVLNNGNTFRVRIKFPLAADADLQMYAHNKSGSALSGGAFLHITGKIYLRWT